MSAGWDRLTRVTAIYLVATAFWGVWATLGQVDSWLVRIALVAGAIVAVGTIWKRGVVPTATAVRRLGAALDAVFELRDERPQIHQWKAHVDHRMDQVDLRLDQIEKHIEADLVVRHEFPHGSSSTD